MTLNPKNARRIKHIDVHWHWIREQVEKKRIILHHVKGVENIADSLTKPLAFPQFMLFIAGLKLDPTQLDPLTPSSN